MDLLACGAMTVFGVQWPLTTQLVLDLPAVTATFVADFEVGVVLVDFIGGTVFPFVELSLHVARVAIVAIGVVSLHIITHPGKGSMEMRFELSETGKGPRRGIGSYDGVHSERREL